MDRLQRGLACFAAIAFVVTFVLSLGVAPGRGSDHQDSPTALSRPGADLSDVFVFPASDPNKVVLAMDVHPLIPPGMGPLTFFDPDVLYEFKIDNAGDYVEHLVIQFRAEGTGPRQRIAMYGPSRPNLLGTRSSVVAQTTAVLYGESTTLDQEMRLFAGPREDPFYFDLAQFVKILTGRSLQSAQLPTPAPPRPAPTAVPAMEDCFQRTGSDFFAGSNVLAIVLELPRQMLAPPGGRLGTIHVWATTSLPDASGAYAQVERVGRPAIKTVFEPVDRRDITNRTTPTDDQVLARSIHQTATIYAPNGAGRSDAIGNALVKLFIPDELTVDLSERGPARYLAVETAGKIAFPTGVVRAFPKGVVPGIERSLGNPYRRFGGRDPSSPVMDITLGALFGSILPKLGLAPDDKAETPCLTSDNVVPLKHVTRTFPYLGNPQ